MCTPLKNTHCAATILETSQLRPFEITLQPLRLITSTNNHPLTFYYKEDDHDDVCNNVTQWGLSDYNYNDDCTCGNVTNPMMIIMVMLMMMMMMTLPVEMRPTKTLLHQNDAAPLQPDPM